MNQKIIIVTLIIVALAVGGVWYYTQPEDSQPVENKTVTEQIKNQNIQSYSLEGTVTKLENGKFTFKTGSVKDTADGRKYVEEEKTVTYLPQTQFFKTSLTNKALASDLKVGSHVIVDTQQNPFERSEFLASKILIQY